MGKIILISGGIKSGKSSFALSFFNKNDRVYFIATAEAKDQEMRKKIILHKKIRPKNFITIEEPVEIINKISKLEKTSSVVVDCVNIWIANMLGIYTNKKILLNVESLCKCLENFKISIVVSNEVGMSLVSPNKLGRRFQELLGTANQILAKLADEVYCMFCGLPIKIK
ncbi:MAG: bifunctional adenosylcobinamide kinase/adenosylcobinamide-phosphate guanylyltransferase [Elusimicrobiota bacterium]|nr:bifunctional adenosylcobinamide kinase/adenosylcobinamide-phosphate guanylyltransferase [Endomicrobiia bacterium]MDW8166660.1 bifunctional adenosylcobinamide kinase/adenosylcobinamide-phosphate guanylyltransferase [Elusimicrobiota bacterium]